MARAMEFTLKTEKQGVYNITRTVTDAIKEGGVESGIALLYCPHTTAAITFNENTDDNVGVDLLESLARTFPESDNYKHSEGNSYAHIRSSVIGCSNVIIIEDGWPLLGIWQNIYFVEFDGPRERKYYLKLIEC
ncbi:MAG: YjbQ family protein [Ruminococcaceae bacterium]|nr:YjbQ family protein [Oscillospiraceae bacterium]